MRTTQLVGLALALLQFQSVQNCKSNVLVSDRLLLGQTIVVNRNKLVPEKVELTSHVRGEVVVQAIDRARTEDCGIREGFTDD